MLTEIFSQMCCYMCSRISNNGDKGRKRGKPVGFVLALLVQEAAEVTKVGNEFHISPRTERLIS